MGKATWNMRRVVLAIIVLFTALFLHIVNGFTRLYYPTPGFYSSSIPDLTGKVIVITGGTTGVGRASAEHLCKKGAKLIVITSRSQKSADEAATEIQKKHCSKEKQTKIIGKALALEDYKAVEKFVEWFRSLNEPLHVLMLNAGFVSMYKETTRLGMEKTIGVNWFGHFYLQQLLQDIVERSAPSRIVILSSNVVSAAPLLIHPIEAYVMGDEAKPPNEYIISKLFNFYHATELHRRLREKGINNVYVNALNPGLVATNVFDYLLQDKNFPYNYVDAIRNVIEKEVESGVPRVIFAFLAEIIGLSPSNGAITQLYAATSPDIERFNISGEFFHPIARREDNSWYYFGGLTLFTSQPRDPVLARKLWEFGESVIASLPK